MMTKLTQEQINMVLERASEQNGMDYEFDEYENDPLPNYCCSCGIEFYGPLSDEDHSKEYWEGISEGVTAVVGSSYVRIALAFIEGGLTFNYP